MNIAIVTIYGDIYSQDRLFNSDSCKIGENLLLPEIILKQRLEELGHNYHTVDMYDFNDIDVLIFQDLNKNSWLLLSAPIDIIKYILKGKWRKDYLYKCVKRKKNMKTILIMTEPPIVCPQSYDLNYHKYFDGILTWDDNLLSSNKYHKFQYPQIPPVKKYYVSFEEKKFITMIAGNKKSQGKNELYSKRYEAIKYFEKHDYEFDLYGFGWETESFKNYKGVVDGKLKILAQYRFAICYENMCNIKGYITEKIFDCFFAGVVPVYLGAENISEYIPADTFIDRREFNGIDELCQFLYRMTPEMYGTYIEAIKCFVDSEVFKDEFSVDVYIKRITNLFLIEEQ